MEVSADMAGFTLARLLAGYRLMIDEVLEACDERGLSAELRTPSVDETDPGGAEALEGSGLEVADVERAGLAGVAELFRPRRYGQIGCPIEFCEGTWAASERDRRWSCTDCGTSFRAEVAAWGYAMTAVRSLCEEPEPATSRVLAECHARGLRPAGSRAASSQRR